MPRNSGGIYTVPPGTLAVTGNVIASAPYNAMLGDVSTALTQSVNVNGTAMMVSPLNMGNQRINNLGIPSATTDAATKGYVDKYPTGWSFRNKIINGEMFINQRAITSSSAGGYTCDRWNLGVTQPTWGSWNLTGTAPPQFNGCLGWVSSGVHTCSSSDIIQFYQVAEACYFSDSLWGASNALPATLSFWVYASLTGTYGVSITNDGAGTRSYTATYAVSSANTWLPITIPIPGDTAGTWVVSGTGGSVAIHFAIASGSTFIAPSANTWLNGNYVAPPGCIQVCGTSGAGLYITGVQFELNPIATAFERRHTCIEAIMCERYFQNAWALSSGAYFPGGSYTLFAPVYLPTAMRVTPSFSVVTNSSSNLTGTPVFNPLSTTSLYASGTSAAAGEAYINCSFTASAEL